MNRLFARAFLLAIMAIMVANLVSGCAFFAVAKPIVRTLLDVARSLCAQHYSEAKPGLSLDEAGKAFCDTDEALAPWLDLALAAKRAGAAKLEPPALAPSCPPVAVSVPTPGTGPAVPLTAASGAASGGAR